MDFNRIQRHKHLKLDLKARIISLYVDDRRSLAEISELCEVSVSNNRDYFKCFYYKQIETLG